MAEIQYNRYIFRIEYFGPKFDSGWQRQFPEKTSVQGALEGAAYQLTSEKVNFIAAGRTDKNVHSLGQIVHADFVRKYSQKVLVDGMNWYLKNSGCRVLEARRSVDKDFHARFSAKTKTYEYLISRAKVCSVFDEERCWWIREKIDLDLELLTKSLDYLVGEHDFSSFRDSSCQANSPVRSIDKIVYSFEQDKIKIQFTARSFLHKQIRIMVGTVVNIAQGKLPDIQTILLAKDRTKAGQTAPGFGLYLREVLYGSTEEA